MDKREEQEKEQQEERFNQITPERKRTIAKYCLMSIIQYLNRTDSQLRVNQENIKKRLCIEHANKSGDLGVMQQELDYIDLVCDELITNKQRYKNMRPSERNGALYKRLEELGVNDLTEPELSPLDQIIKEVMGYDVAEEESKPKTKNDLDRLYRPYLLFRNSVTGERGIRYTRYGERRVPQIYEYKGKSIGLEKVGEMTYLNSFAAENNLAEYLVTTGEDSARVFLYDLSFEKIEKVPEYRRVLFDELLSHESLTVLNANGYIGEIVDSKITPGTYTVDYDPERFTAVAELKAKLREIEQQKKSAPKKSDVDDFDK